MPNCFVIQPFDKGNFDKRYDGVLTPAIKAAGLEPYRVDRDPSASIPIETIEAEIKAARICLADISLNNPNVWYEVGFAYAARKEVILISSEDRPEGKFPFDVHHRNIISYQTGSPQAFEELKEKITSRLVALLKKEEILNELQSDHILANVSGLQGHELMVIASICESIGSVDQGCSSFSLVREMENSGFTRAATNIGVKTLQMKGFVASENTSDQDGDPYSIYTLTEQGWDWVIKNSEKFNLQSMPRTARSSKRPPAMDDEIPF
jgi:hypothetical protein